ncbi:DNA cytosine methyltransferase [Corynebacterium endometrii]|uniref:Cytosine-specific methyltransferase n=1 Tax=Corynebacterium endometrii TaxID=2488819 RepID=A0A4P7QF96_9CORY|nr:DNA cytosine methyltransferase [Corynebacterium endometrii]QCB28199.1 putative BsuMI modification methylase subunit YdiO [Corynebacterium endometrii]
MKIRITDLFAGAGGLTAGLCSSSGVFTPFQAVEWDLDAALTYKQNFRSSDVFIESIIEWADSASPLKTDVVVGGPPCQGFSTLGKREENDEKNFLWEQYAKVVEKTSPRYFVMENVPQFTKSEQLNVFQKELDEGALQHYNASVHIVNTADYGSPQSRKRVIILGTREDCPKLNLPAPTSLFGQIRTVRDAFNGLEPKVIETELPDRMVKHDGKLRPGPFLTSELHITRKFTTLSLERFSHIPPGGNRFDLPDNLKAPCWLRHQTGSGDVMGRLFWDRPSVTIRTEFNKPEKGRYLHPEENRAITHQEAARLMGFPDDYKWVGSKTSIARQIGNAVPIELGDLIGKAIVSLFQS